jgi:CRISPR-associated protein Csd1
MSALASPVGAYERMADRGKVPLLGYSAEKIGFCIVLKGGGTPAFAPVDLRDNSGKKPEPRLVPVPASFKRPGVTPKAFFLWDNTAFSLGVTGSENCTVASS